MTLMSEILQFHFKVIIDEKGSLMTGRKIASTKSTGSALDIRAMRIFVAVAEAGSFVAGGKAMGLTRSSNRVKR